MLRRQVWMANEEFDYITKKQCNLTFIHGTYALEGKADSKFSLIDIWNLF